MTEIQKEKIRQLMRSEYGLVTKACRELNLPVSTYWNIMSDRSDKTDVMQSIVDKAKEIKKRKPKLSI